MFFLDEQTNFKILKNKDFFEFIDMERKIDIHILTHMKFYFSQGELNPNLIKRIKIASKKEEYELEL